MRTAALIVTLLAAIGALGEATDCVNPSLVQADNRMVTSHFAGSSNGYDPTYWYAFYGQAGHSYSVEFVATIDNEDVNTSIAFGNLYVWGPSDIGSLQQNSCAGPSSVAYYATQTYSPALAKGKYGTGQRISFVAAASGLHIISVTNFQAAGTYSYRVVDTTLFNARWSTYYGYDTMWGFNNFSDMQVTGTLYVYESSGRLIWSGGVSIAPGGHSSKTSNTSDLNLPRNDAGYAIFSYNGPPQAILADGFIANANATVLIPTKFESRNSQ